MNEEIQILQNIGVQKIFEKTHIPIHHVHGILSSDFDVFSKVQFLGFISILEREYNEKFPQIREAAESFFDEKKAVSEENSLFVTPEKKKSYANLYIAIVVIALVVIFIFNYALSPSEDKNIKVDNRLIEDVKKTIEPKVAVVIDTNVTDTTDVNESNLSKPSAKVLPKKIEKVLSSFKIVTKSKVWFGYIDTKTNIKSQKTFKGTIKLDPSKTWLLLFGHGYIDMYIDGKIQKFDSRDNVRFIYENGTLRTIDKKEFKRLNRGRSW